MINREKICNIVNAQIISGLKYALDSVTNRYGFIEDLQEILNDECDHDAVKAKRIYDYFYKGLIDDLVIGQELFEGVDLEDKEDEEEDAYEEYFRRFK